MTGEDRRATSQWPYTDRERPRVVVAGGGVAALEACLALRDYLSEDELEILLVTASDRFELRPLAVRAPFSTDVSWSLALATFAADNAIELLIDAVIAVASTGRMASTTSGREIPYDALLLAVGGRAVDAVPGAMTFRGPGDVEAFRAVVDELAALPRPRIAFAMPAAASWPLPLYELALLTAGDLRARGTAVDMTFVTPELAPLSVFGERASELVAAQLTASDIELLVGAVPREVTADALVLADGRRLAADHVIALPRIVGRRLDAVPRDAEDFIPVDDHGRVTGLSHVYAAGDITNLPLKHGGLAARQADAAVEAIVAELGVPITPRPFRPILQGVLYSDRDPAYLHADTSTAGSGAEPRPYSLWWPPSKIAGRLLAPYLVLHAGAPRAPERRPQTDILPIDIDLSAEQAPSRPASPA